MTRQAVLLEGFPEETSALIPGRARLCKARRGIRNGEVEQLLSGQDIATATYHLVAELEPKTGTSYCCPKIPAMIFKGTLNRD